jgi:hypothetical protein
MENDQKTEPEKKKINMTINDGQTFYAHELSINFNPLQFIFDFKNVTPRIDPRSKDGNVLFMIHNVVIVDPYHAKEICNLLNEVIKKYETEFGEIEKPKALKTIEKKMEKDKKEADKKFAGLKEKKTTRETPTYLG